MNPTGKHRMAKEPETLSKIMIDIKPLHSFPTGIEMASTARELEAKYTRRKLWLKVFYTKIRDGESQAYSANYADNALEEYDKRFTLQSATEAKKENHD